jgi:hypothetical protein
MARPRDPDTPTELRECEVHGLVEFRRHKKGKHPKTGEQKYRWRCPQCHAAENR